MTKSLQDGSPMQHMRQMEQNRAAKVTDYAEELTLEYIDGIINPHASDAELNSKTAQDIRAAAVETVRYLAQGRYESDQLARIINRAGSEFARRMDERGVPADDKFRVAAQAGYSGLGDAVMQGLRAQFRTSLPPRP